MVGVTEYCDYPEEALAKAKVGTFTEPNLEAILAQDPDLVLATGGVQVDLLDRMEESGLTVYAVNPMTFDQTVASILEIGELTGADRQAEDIVADMNARAVEVARRVNAMEDEGKERPRVFYEIYYENSVWTAGTDSIISDLIRLAGGENIGDAESSEYYEFSAERLFAENPQVYLVGSGSMFVPGDISGKVGMGTHRRGEGRSGLRHRGEPGLPRRAAPHRRPGGDQRGPLPGGLSASQGMRHTYACQA